MESKHRYLSVRDWTQKDYGRNAITGILGGAIISSVNSAITHVVGGFLVILGLVCGLVWIYKSISARVQKAKVGGV